MMFLTAFTTVTFLSLFPGNTIAFVENNNQISSNHVSFFPEATIFPEAYYKIKDDATIINAADSALAISQSYGKNAQQQPSDSSHSYGTAFVRPSFLCEMQAHSNLYITDGGNTLVGCVDEEKDGDDDAAPPRKMQTKYLTESSKLHTDCVIEDDYNNKIRINVGKVGFFFRNTNTDAYFDTSDGNLCIPIVEGNFVHFDGTKPHRTVINSGFVDLLGPIQLSTADGVMIRHHQDDTTEDDDNDKSSSASFFFGSEVSLFVPLLVVAIVAIAFL